MHALPVLATVWLPVEPSLALYSSCLEGNSKIKETMVKHMYIGRKQALLGGKQAGWAFML